METWRLKAKSITKYNPKNYNSKAVYTLDEWTSRSDIGKKIDSFTNTILTIERYLEVENNYINAVKIFIKDLSVEKIRIIELYKISDEDDFKKWNDNALFNFFKNLEEKEYSSADLDAILRLVLREYIQVAVKLITPEMDSTVYFGEDYYMYFVSDSIDFNSYPKKLKQYQMFVM